MTALRPIFFFFNSMLFISAKEVSHQILCLKKKEYKPVEATFITYVLKKWEE